MYWNIFKIQKEINKINNLLLDNGTYSMRVNNVLGIDERSNLLIRREKLESNKNFIIQIYTLLLTSLIPFLTLIIFYFQNNLANRDFEFRLRPYLVTDGFLEKINLQTGKTIRDVKIKNAGSVPAIVFENSMSCEGVDLSYVPSTLIIGPNQIKANSLIDNNENQPFNCYLSLKYRSAIDSLSNEDYELKTNFNYIISKDGTSIMNEGTTTMK
jgi:hypothetical protein